MKWGDGEVFQEKGTKYLAACCQVLDPRDSLKSGPVAKSDAADTGKQLPPWSSQGAACEASDTAGSLHV